MSETEDSMDDMELEVSKQKIQRLAKECSTLRELLKQLITTNHECSTTCRAANEIMGELHGNKG